MMKLPSLLSSLALAASLAAQCPDTVVGISIGEGDDLMLNMQPIGFAFPFNGTTYTDVHVCTNGYLELSNGGVPAPGFGDGTSTTAEFVAGSPRICPLWTDFVIDSFTNNGSVYVNSTAAKCTITWRNAQNFGFPAPLFDVQAQLFPTGEIKFFYGPGATNNSTATNYWAGLVGVTTGGGATLPAASDISAGGATLDPTLFEAWATANGFDMPNNGLHLIPTNPGWVFLPLGAPALCASSTNYGTGCVAQPDTFHEEMTIAAFDLANSTLTMLRQADGYTVMNLIPGVIVAHTGNAVVVADGDDIEETVALSGPMPVANGTTSSLTVCSNGRIALSAAGNGTDYFPDAALFIDWPSTTICADWHDYNPGATGSGKVLFEEIGGIAYVTWNGVYSFGTTTPNTFQYQFDLATGNCTVVYGAVAVAGGTDHLVGYSVGGPSPNGLVVDISVAAATPFLVNDSATGLQLTTNSSPVLGSNTFAYVISAVPPVLPVAFLFFGDTQINPGIDLTFLGMPTCFAYTNANLLSVSAPVIGPSAIVPLPIPANPAIAGSILATQGIALSANTPSGLVSSNGNLSIVGY